MGVLHFKDSILDAAQKMSEGNLGSLKAMLQVNKIAEEMGKDPMEFLHMLDERDVRGEALYMLWNDCCDRSHTNFQAVLLGMYEGRLMQEELLRHINQKNGRGIPFTFPLETFTE